jgi:uncharacterized membrane protein YgcG
VKSGKWPSGLALAARALKFMPNMKIPLLRSRFLLLASVLFLALAAVTHPAYAGTLQVRDEAHLLSAGDVHKVQSVVSGAPFDARLVVTSEYPQALDLGRMVGSLVTEPNIVVVGLDPEHRHVQVHFGNGSHISRASWPAIESAGNDAFRHSDWAGGVAVIFRAASAAVADVPGGRATDAARPSLFGPVLLLMLVAGAIGIAVHFARKRAMYGSSYGGGPGYGPRPYPPGAYPPGYPMGPPQGGMGPLGGGLIGAGLGGLAGYELGKLEGEREGRDRDRGGGASAPDENFDEGGGGGSSWDDGGGGGGFDGGGGDSGGGSDF